MTFEACHASNSPQSVCVGIGILKVLQVPGGEGQENRRTWSLCPLTSEGYNQASCLGPRASVGGARIKTQEPEKNQSHLNLMSSIICSNQLFTKQNMKSWSQQVNLSFPTPRTNISFPIYYLGKKPGKGKEIWKTSHPPESSLNPKKTLTQNFDALFSGKCKTHTPLTKWTVTHSEE